MRGHLRLQVEGACSGRSAGRGFPGGPLKRRRSSGWAASRAGAWRKPCCRHPTFLHTTVLVNSPLGEKNLPVGRHHGEWASEAFVNRPAH